MSSFLRNFKYLKNNREQQIIKDNLITQLAENAKEIQYEYKNIDKEGYIELTDCTNSLCTTLEAIFLHGLKDSFLWQTMNVLSGNDVNNRPNPNFWPILLNILHAQTIQQIDSLSQITTDIGKCRSWIRLSLNESIFSSYLNTIRKNSSLLIPYYKKYSFLNDNDIMDMASKIIEGIEIVCKINLPYNSTLINQWTNISLQLSGIWLPSINSYQINDCIDIVNTITDNIPTPKPLQINEIFIESISNSPFNTNQLNNYINIPSTSNNIDLNEQENLKILLKKIDNIIDIDINNDIDDKIINNDDKIKYPINNLNNSWTDENINDKLNNKNIISRSNSIATSSINSIKSPTIERYSYNTLLIKHEKNRSLTQLLDIQDVWERFIENSRQNSSIHCDTLEQDLDNDDNNLDFEIVTKSMVEQFTINELKEMIEYLCKLSHEYGLDSQGFLCKTCAHPLGIGFANAQVCAFTGNYYCESCISTNQYVIPSKIIYNFDFHRYTVSKRTEIFLNEFQDQPFIDLKLLNPNIYQASIDMANLQSLRIQLNFIRSYLYTCCESTFLELENYVKNKSYLYEHIHQYTINDLYMILNGELEQLLIKTVKYGEQHIIKCNLCSVKGFICEICESPKVLYPFHINTTFRCQICGAVFHDKCLNQLQPCPKCDRKRKREDLPLMEAVHML